MTLAYCPVRLLRLLRPPPRLLPSRLPPASTSRPWRFPFMELSTTPPHPHDEAPLSKKKCVPCNSKDLRPMNVEAAKILLEKIPGWELADDESGCLKLTRSWKAKTFLKGLEYFKIIGDVAEDEGHHPNLHLVNWNNVKVDIWTHAVGGLTENDFILAAKISDLNVQGLLRNRLSGATSSTVTS